MKTIKMVAVGALLVSATLPVHANSRDKAAVGGLFGGVVGAAVGQNVGGQEGAVIGAVIGATAGAALLVDRDRRSRDVRYDNRYVAPQRAQLVRYDPRRDPRFQQAAHPRGHAYGHQQGWNDRRYQTQYVQQGWRQDARHTPRCKDDRRYRR